MTRAALRRRAALAAALALALAIAACGGARSPRSPANGEPPPGAADTRASDTRTEIERRRDTACARLGPRLARCAVADSDAQLAAGKITRQQHDEATKPEVVRALAEDFRKKCRAGYMSSRQVRVLEVCDREETECAPLEACLKHLAPEAGAAK